MPIPPILISVIDPRDPAHPSQFYFFPDTPAPASADPHDPVSNDVLVFPIYFVHFY